MLYDLFFSTWIIFLKRSNVYNILCGKKPYFKKIPDIIAWLKIINISNAINVKKNKEEKCLGWNSNSQLQCNFSTNLLWLNFLRYILNFNAF